MLAHVIVATKGRSQVVATLLNRLTEQTLSPFEVIVIGTCEEDLAGAREFTGGDFKLVLRSSEEPGSCIQRNIGVEHALGSAPSPDEQLVVFFDDDYRPHPEWLARCVDVFERQREVVGLTGRVLADGVHGPGLTEEEAQSYLSGARPPTPHWTAGRSQRDLGAAYGCNMAFRASVLRQHRFDENLPLYGWQEDRDLTARALRLGRVVMEPSCTGVHLGNQGGRTSGVRFGYSQVANPLYLITKGSMNRRTTATFLMRHFASNVVNSVRGHEGIDYPGRLRGNAAALKDLLRGQCHPRRILEL